MLAPGSTLGVGAPDCFSFLGQQTGAVGLAGHFKQRLQSSNTLGLRDPGHKAANVANRTAKPNDWPHLRDLAQHFMGTHGVHLSLREAETREALAHRIEPIVRNGCIVGSK